ncbi:MAG: hypothetical protein GYA87_02440 [Christensenellaceae bacterium]|nr:hypothetical protein [Christensenellaceae bacterium]
MLKKRVTTKAPRSDKRTSRSSRNFSKLILILVFLALLFFMYLIFPKERQIRAIKTLGGVVDPSVISSDSYYEGLLISEVMSINTSAVPDENGEFNDYIEVFNASDRDINMRGVGLSDRSDRIKFLFPDFELKSGEYTIVFASNKNRATVGSPFHAKFKLSSLGETIYLFDPNAFVINSMAFPILASNESYQLGNDGKYFSTDSYSPGFPNDEQGFIDYRTSMSVNIGAVIINEVMPAPRSGLRDEDDELSDWIELYNTTDQDISLANYALSDKENKPLEWRFPIDAVIKAKGYYLVFCSGKDRKLPEGQISHTNFRLSAEHETIVLSDSRGRLIDRIAIDNVPRDVSYGRNENNEWQFFEIATPGLPNNSNGQAQADRLLMSYNPTGVYIMEVVASNDMTQIGAGLTTSDFVELYNTTAKPVNLTGCGLSDNINRPRRWTFPSGTVIEPNSYLIVCLDGNPSLTTQTEYHANFRLLRAGGETICFSDPTGRILDRIPLPHIPTNYAYGRMIGTNGYYYFKAASPGRPNTDAFIGFAKDPSFSIPGGQYKGTVQVTINVPENTNVYYTLDGSLPTMQSTPYRGEVFEINAVTAIRARAFGANGLEPSNIVTQTYLMSLYHTFPIVAITVDPDELYNPETGMFTPGENIDKSGGIPFKNAVYREFGKNERPGHIEMYDVDGTMILDQDMEFGLQGQYSLDMPQKTMKVRAKSRYGTKYFYAPLFEDRPFTEYKTFVLRNSGNDAVWTRLMDSFQSRLVEHLDTNVINQAWRPVIVYINGRYWGHYNMRERADRFMVAQHEGLTLREASNMDIIEANRKVYYGNGAEFNELKEVAKNLYPGKNPDDLKYLTDRIDVINYFDFLSIQMFYGNSDPGNQRCYKIKEEDSKWRWLLFDMDYGLFNSNFNSPRSYLKESGSGDQKINNILIRKLLESEEMKDLFLTRFGIVFQKFTTNFMLEEFEKMVAILEPEMRMHFNRWAEFNDKAINIDSPTTPEGAMTYWKTRLDRARNIMKKRPTLLYGFIQEQFNLSDEQMIHYFGEKPIMPPDAI